MRLYLYLYLFASQCAFYVRWFIYRIQVRHWHFRWSFSERWQRCQGDRSDAIETLMRRMASREEWVGGWVDEWVGNQTRWANMPKKQKKRAMIFCQFGIPRYRIQSYNPPAPTRPTHSTHSTPLDHLSSFSIPAELFMAVRKVKSGQWPSGEHRLCCCSCCCSCCCCCCWWCWDPR